MRFNDDEPIVPIQEEEEDDDESGEQHEQFIFGKVQVTVLEKTVAAPDESECEMTLEITGTGSGDNRFGLDLVMVLDVGGRRIYGPSFANMKIGIHFLIKKLRPIDRLSIVAAFGSQTGRLCPLRQITESSQNEIESMVHSLVAHGRSNITYGLEMALETLNDRRFAKSRVRSIILMSDCEHEVRCDAAKLPFGDVPVYTFGYGDEYDHELLNAIADNSMGGTFKRIETQDNLRLAYSQCLAGLLTVVARDVKVTFTQNEWTIKKVFAENYPQFRDNDVGSVTVEFGNLYAEEIHQVIVKLKRRS